MLTSDPPRQERTEPFPLLRGRDLPDDDGFATGESSSAAKSTARTRSSW
ncbi:hypothetical protein VSH64_31435 [Amycolatopsis rhabdoformis]|uniref:Uncharacterized protein n=1 Tax=Amycolatopsis rhabdoformis TaxID=1448059 RepID=A0ABZ1HYX6_9PSEU|nr:hypothetical protein [Amycolatopsis rhabdoformis]WSE27357.1 hypothetical protein VSH64_31435 [Amycolatopsis rhabdoformis]